MEASQTQTILDLINDYLKVEPIEEAFLCVVVNVPHLNAQKTQKFTNQLVACFANLNIETRDATLKQYLIRASMVHLNKLKVLFNILLKLVNNNIVPARVMCEKLLSCEKLVVENRHFWIEAFILIKKIIVHVDYKGVREIMKICRDKAQMFPSEINGSILPQFGLLEELITFIFDRNNCLLPAYFIADEIMKSSQTHWKINKLMTDLMEEFRHIAQMVSIIGHCHMLPIIHHYGYADNLMNSWKLDNNTLKINYKVSLPYEPELLEPQSDLLKYVLDQPYSKEMVSTMLNLQNLQKQKQPSPALQDHLVDLMIFAMEKTEADTASDDSIANEWLWLHLSSQLIHFVLSQYANFMQITISLNEKIADREFPKSRDHIMWVLLQFISGSIQKNSISIFLPMFKLFDALYPEQEPLPVPDCSKTTALRAMAPVCIWIHLMKKARLENMNIIRSIPIALKNHHEFLQHLANHSPPMNLNNDFQVVLLCNAYSTNQEYFSRPMALLVENLNSTQKNPGGPAVAATIPFSMVVLDSLTLHSKMSLMHSFVTQMIKQAQSKTSVPAPALIETYSRLLIYTEIESLGIKGLLGQLFPAVFKAYSWSILHILLEMFSYRLHHIPTHYRFQLLSHLHSLASVPQTNKMQLNLCFESTALRLLTGLGSVEIQPQLSRYFNEKTPSPSVVSCESEELNRVLILNLGRSMHITGSGNEMQPWCKDLLSNIMQNTPHNWASHSLKCFPPALNEFFTQNNLPTENKQLLKKSVDEEYQNFISMSNENDIIAHFIRPNTTPLFLCLLYKMIWEKENLTPVAYKILEGISARALSPHLRKLCDYLVYEVATHSGKDFIQKSVDTINNMIWKYNVVSIDRLVLCLVLRTQEGNDAQICFYIIQLLLLKASEIRNRVQEFVKENSPDHWKQNNWHEKHLSFNQKYPEKFSPDELSSLPPLPTYFGNVCLRFLPVLDIVIHRFIELNFQSVHQILEIILDHLSCLYKFHDRPITYLFNTLHFYERILRDRPSLKKKLVNSVIGALNDVRPPNWALSETYQQYLKNPDLVWNPDLNYYLILCKRLVDTISGDNFFYTTDWRFNEFPNAASHASSCTCVELLSLPLSPQIVANNLIDVILKCYHLISGPDLHKYINVIGILLSALPEAYWSVLYDRLQEIINSPKMVNWSFRYSAFELFNFKIVQDAMIENPYAYLLGICHAVLHHMGCWKLATLIHFIKDKLKPVIRNEQQLIYLCHIFGPFLQRIDAEKVNGVAEIAIVIYELLEVVDKNHGPAPLVYMDPICDFLYHIKYRHVGDIIINEVEAIIKRLRPVLQMRLRFIAHLNVEEIVSDKNEMNIVNNIQMNQQQLQMGYQNSPHGFSMQQFQNMQQMHSQQSHQSHVPLGMRHN